MCGGDEEGRRQCRETRRVGAEGGRRAGAASEARAEERRATEPRGVRGRGECRGGGAVRRGGADRSWPQGLPLVWSRGVGVGEEAAGTPAILSARALRACAALAGRVLGAEIRDGRGRERGPGEDSGRP